MIRAGRQRLRRTLIALPLCALFVDLAPLAASAKPDSDPTTCVIKSTAGSFNHQTGVLVDGQCVPWTPGNRHSSSGPTPVTRSVDCGQPPVQRRDGAGPQRWNYKQCGRTVKTCQQTPPGGGPPTPVDAFVTQVQDPVTKKWTSGAIWCPADATPVPGTALLRDRALRLLPHVQVGALGATGGASGVVRTQTILWAKTAPTRPLGTVDVIGQRVWLSLHLTSAHWDFGDGSAGTTTSPGKAYDPTGDPCSTAMCADYYGHVYTSTGTKTITLTVSWNASYSLDGQHYAPVSADPLAGPPATTTITLRQARGVLVPNPDGG